MASKQKFIEGQRVTIKTYEDGSVWEVYAVRQDGRKMRYSVRKLTDESITLVCNIEGKKLERVEEK